MATGPAAAGQATVRPHAEPFYSGDGRLGVLVLHGFTGSPRSVRPWGEHLAGEGFRVAVPRLPGHGTTWQDLNTTSWQTGMARRRRSSAR